LEKSNARYKATADKSRREKVLEGDMVMVYMRKKEFLLKCTS